MHRRPGQHGDSRALCTFSDRQRLADADSHALESYIQSTGFFRNKAKNIKACCHIIAEQFGGEVPSNLEDLVNLPGVGRKTANVVLGNSFDIPGITVDTHVARLSKASRPDRSR